MLLNWVYYLQSILIVIVFYAQKIQTSVESWEILLCNRGKWGVVVISWSRAASSGSIPLSLHEALIIWFLVQEFGQWTGEWKEPQTLLQQSLYVIASYVAGYFSSGAFIWARLHQVSIVQEIKKYLVRFSNVAGCPSKLLEGQALIRCRSLSTCTRYSVRNRASLQLFQLIFLRSSEYCECRSSKISTTAGFHA